MIPATLRLRQNVSVIHVLVDNGFLRTNLISILVADLLNADGGTLHKTDIILTVGVGEQSYGVQGIMNVTITPTDQMMKTQRNDTYACAPSCVVMS